MMQVNNKEELMKLVNKNPKLPLVFMINNDEISEDYNYTVLEKFRAYKSEIYKFKQWESWNYTDDRYDVFEYYSNELCNEEEYENLSEKEYDKAIDKYIDENVEHYEAIVIYID